MATDKTYERAKDYDNSAELGSKREYISAFPQRSRRYLRAFESNYGIDIDPDYWLDNTDIEDQEIPQDVGIVSVSVESDLYNVLIARGYAYNIAAEKAKRWAAEPSEALSEVTKRGRGRPAKPLETTNRLLDSYNKALADLALARQGTEEELRLSKQLASAYSGLKRLGYAVGTLEGHDRLQRGWRLVRGLTRQSKPVFQ